jgi:hypothetical protein
MKNTQPNTRLGNLTALVTFAIATTICGFYFFTGNLDYGFYGYFFFLFAVPINIIIFIILLIYAPKTREPKRVNRSAALMLLNIPVAIFYFGVGIYFTGVMRITIENKTGQDIKNIKILGCENEELKVLKNGESETVWIEINGDCSISMSYMDAKGIIQEETVVGYVTSGMGQKFTYHVGQGETGW